MTAAVEPDSEATGVLGRVRRRVFRRDADRWTRRASDGGRVVFAIVVVAALAFHAGHETATERALVAFVGSLTSELRTPVLALYGLGALWAVGLLVAALFVARRWRLARDMAIAALLGWLAGRALGVLVADGSLSQVLEIMHTVGRSPQFPLTRLVVVVAAVSVASPHLSRPVRRIGQSIVVLLTFCALYLATAFPGDLLAAIALGWGIAALVHLVFGVPVGKPSVEQVSRALSELGLDVRDLRRAERQPLGASSFVGHDEQGDLMVTVIGRDEVDAQLLTKAWRFVAYRNAASTFAVTRRQQVEHTAFLLLLAAENDARVAAVAAAGMAGDSVAVLAERTVPGVRLAAMDPDLITDTVLADLWRQIECLRAARISHRQLNAERILVDVSSDRDGGAVEVAIVGFANATTRTRTDQLVGDVAEALAATAAVVGDERAIQAALNGVGGDALVAALPVLQVPALTPATRSSLGDDAGDRLQQLREATAQAAGTDAPALTQLERVKPRSLLMAGGTLVAIGVLFSQVGDPGVFWDTISSANVGYLALAFLLDFATTAAFAIAFMGTVPQRLPLWRCIEVQIAMGFSNLAVPVAGDAAVQIRFLQKQGVDLASAVASGGVLSSVSEIVVQLAVFGIALMLSPTGIDIGRVPTESIVVTLLGIVLLIGIAVAVVMTVRRIREIVVPPVARAARTVWSAVKTPERLALMIVGNVIAQLLYAGALLACLEAFGASVSFWTLLALNIGVGTIAGLVPVPGGGTAVSTIGMSGALVALGVPEAAAGAAVLAREVVGTFLPAVPGFFATRDLIQREIL